MRQGSRQSVDHGQRPPDQPLLPRNPEALMEPAPLAMHGSPALESSQGLLPACWGLTAGIAAVAPVIEKLAGTGEQALVLAGHQRQPPVMQHRVLRDGQGALQQGPVAQQGATGDAVALGEFYQAWRLGAGPVPLPQGVTEWAPSVIDLARIAVEQEWAWVGRCGGFDLPKLGEAGGQAFGMPDVVLVAESHIGRTAGEQQAVEGSGGTEALGERGQQLQPAGMGLGPALQDGEGCIAGAVIVNQHAAGAQGLLLQAAQLLLEEERAVPGGQHHLQLRLQIGLHGGGAHHHCRPHLRK